MRQNYKIDGMWFIDFSVFCCFFFFFIMFSNFFIPLDNVIQVTNILSIHSRYLEIHLSHFPSQIIFLCQTPNTRIYRRGIEGIYRS